MPSVETKWNDRIEDKVDNLVKSMERVLQQLETADLPTLKSNVEGLMIFKRAALWAGGTLVTIVVGILVKLITLPALAR